MTDLLEFVKNVGVPAAIAFYLLWRLDRRLIELVTEVRRLHDSINIIVNDQNHRLRQMEDSLRR